MRNNHIIIIILIMTVFSAPFVLGQNESHREYVYVPVDEWNAVIGDQPKGIWMPYQKYRELLDKQPDPSTKPPVQVAVIAANYRAEPVILPSKPRDPLAGKTLRIESIIKIKSLSDMPQPWVFGTGLSGIEQAKLNDQEVAIIEHQQKQNDIFRYYTVMLPKKGEYQLRFISYFRLKEKRDGLEAQLVLSNLPRQIFFMKTIEGFEFKTNLLHVNTLNEKQQQQLVVHLGQNSQLTLGIFPEEKKDVKKPIVIAHSKAVHQIMPESVLSQFDIALEVRHHLRKEFEFLLPKEVEIVRVSEAQWTKFEEKESQRLLVRLEKKITGKKIITVKCRRTLLKDGSFTLPTAKVLGEILHQDGMVVVEKSPDIRLDVLQINLDNQGKKARRINHYGLGKAKFAAHFAAIFWQPDYQITLSKKLIMPIVEATMVSSMAVYPDIMEMVVDYNFDVKEGKLKQLALKLPGNWSLVKIEGWTGSFRLASIDLSGHYIQEGILRLPLPRKLGKGDRLKLNLLLKNKPTQGDISLPLVKVQSNSNVTVRSHPSFFGIIADSDYKIALKPGYHHLSSVDLALIRSLAIKSKNLRLGLRVETQEAHGTINVQARNSQTSLVIVDYITVEPERLRCAVVMTFDTQNASRDSFHFQLPAKFSRRGEEKGSIKLHVDDEKKWIKEIRRTPLGETSDICQWDIKLQRRVMGSYVLYLSYSIPINSGHFVYDLPILKVPGTLVQVKGITGVAATSEAELSFPAQDEIEAVSTDELPTFFHPEFPLNADFLHAFKYTKFNRRLRLDVTFHERVKVISAILNKATISTYLPEPGLERVFCEYHLNHTGLQYFYLDLPEKADFWSAVVDGKGEKPLRQGDKLAIPIPRRNDGNANVIRVIYEREIEKIKSIGTLSLERPKSDEQIPVQQLYWQVYFPKEYRIGGNYRSLSQSQLPWYEQAWESLPSLPSGGVGEKASEMAPRENRRSSSIDKQVAQDEKKKGKTRSRQSHRESTGKKHSYKKNNNFREKNYAQPKTPRPSPPTTTSEQIHKIKPSRTGINRRQAERLKKLLKEEKKRDYSGIDDKEGDMGIMPETEEEIEEEPAELVDEMTEAGESFDNKPGKSRFTGTDKDRLALKGEGSFDNNEPFDGPFDSDPEKGGKLSATEKQKKEEEWQDNWKDGKTVTTKVVQKIPSHLADDKKALGLNSLEFKLNGDMSSSNPAFHFSVSYVTDSRIQRLSPSAMPSLDIAYVKYDTARSLENWLMALAAVAGIGMWLLLHRIPPVVVFMALLLLFTFLPGWFGMWLMPYCNALIWGLWLSALLAFFVFIGRKVLSWSKEFSMSASIAILLIFCHTGYSQDNIFAPRQKVEQKSQSPVYVPYDPGKLDDLLKEKAHPKDVFVPYDLYVQLWNNAYPEQAIQTVNKDRKPDYILYHSKYEGAVDQGQITFSAEFAVEVLRGPTEALLGLKGVAIKKSIVEGKEGMGAKPLYPTAEGYKIVLPSPGRYKIKIDFLPPMRDDGKRDELYFGIIPSPTAACYFRLAADLQVYMPGFRGHWFEKIEGRQKTVSMFPGKNREIRFRWSQDYQGHLEQDVQVEAEHNHVLQVRDQLLTLRGRINYHISQGKADKLRVRLPGNYTVVDLQCAQIEQWILSQEGDHNDIILRLQENTQNTVLQFVATRELPALPVREHYPEIIPLDVRADRESGMATLEYHNAYNVDIENSPYFERSNTHGDMFAQVYKYNTHPYRLSFDISWQDDDNLAYAPARQKSRSQARQPGISMKIDEDKIEIDYNVQIQIKGAPLFYYKLMCPDDYQVVSVTGSQIRNWTTEITKEKKQEIYIVFNTSIRKGQAILLHVQLKKLREESDTKIPVPYFSSPQLKRHSGTILVSSAKDIDLKPQGTFTKLVDIDLSGFHRPGNYVKRFAYLYRLEQEQKYSGLFIAQSRRPELEMTAAVQLLVEDDWLNWGYFANYRIKYAGVDTFHFRLPLEVGEHIDIVGENIRERHMKKVDVDQEKFVEWTVYLHNKVHEKYNLSIFSEVQKNNGTGIRVPRIIFPPGSEKYPKLVRQKLYIIVDNQSRYQLETQSKGVKAVNSFPYFFSFDTRQFIYSLDQAQIGRIKRIFSRNRHGLSHNARIEVKKRGQEWLVLDNKKQYLLVKHNHEIKVYENLLPAHMPLSALASKYSSAYKVEERNWQLSFIERKPKMEQRAQTVIEAVRVKTMVDQEGEARHKIIYYLRYGGQQFLELSNLEQAKLWAVFVGDYFVEPATKKVNGKPHVLIPLHPVSPVQPEGQKLKITLVYSHKIDALSKSDRACFALPKVVNIPEVGKLYWIVMLNRNYLYKFGGNVSQAVPKDYHQFVEEISNNEQKQQVTQAKLQPKQKKKQDKLRYAGRYNSLQNDYQGLWNSKQASQQKELIAVQSLSNSQRDQEMLYNKLQQYGRRNLDSISRAGQLQNQARKGKKLYADLRDNQIFNEPSFTFLNRQEQKAENMLKNKGEKQKRTVSLSHYTLQQPPDMETFYFFKEQGEAELEITRYSKPADNKFWITVQFLGYLLFVFCAWHFGLFNDLRQYDRNQFALLFLIIAGSILWLYLFDFVHRVMEKFL